MAEKRDVTERHGQIEDWRRRIDLVDEQLMRLLNSRSACAVELGRIKRSLGLPIYSAERSGHSRSDSRSKSPGHGAGRKRP